MQEKLQNEKNRRKFDVGKALGALHPITLVENEICNLMIAMGFEVASGPKSKRIIIISKRLIFEDHPARDMQRYFLYNRQYLITYAYFAYAGASYGKETASNKMICPAKCSVRTATHLIRPYFIKSKDW